MSTTWVIAESASEEYLLRNLRPIAVKISSHISLILALPVDAVLENSYRSRGEKQEHWEVFKMQRVWGLAFYFSHKKIKNMTVFKESLMERMMINP